MPAPNPLTGTVVGDLRTAVPGISGANGAGVFTASVPYLIVTDPDTLEDYILNLAPVPFTVVDGVPLVAGVAPVLIATDGQTLDINPKGWWWQIAVELEGEPLPIWPLYVDAGQANDIVPVAPIPPQSAFPVTRGLPGVGEEGPVGPSGALGATFSSSGGQSVRTYTTRFYCNAAQTIQSVRASVGTAPTGAAFIVDILKNGASIFAVTPAHRPAITSGTNTALSGAPDVTALALGDYLTVAVVQVGSSIAGSDLSVQVVAA